MDNQQADDGMPRGGDGKFVCTVATAELDAIKDGLLAMVDGAQHHDVIHGDGASEQQ
jgi:hypothetical protein